MDNESTRALSEGASKLADELGEVAGRCSSERDRETIIMACDALRAARLAATKTIYVKPLRTLVAVDERYADQIRDLLNAASRPMPGREEIARIIDQSWNVRDDDGEHCQCRECKDDRQRDKDIALVKADAILALSQGGRDA